MLGYRNNDAVLTICQNNAAKSIEIVELNDAASKLTGYNVSELAGHALAEIIPARIANLLSEYVEFDGDTHDVGEVLSKVQSFSLIAKDKSERSFRLKVVRGESSKEKNTFRLVLQGTMDVRKDDALRKTIQDNFKGHEVMDPTLGVPDRKSLEKDMELASYYNRKTNLRASFVMIQPDHLDAIEKQYGEKHRVGFLKHIANICRRSLRPDDVVGAVSDKQLGVLLLDSESDSTRMVANRLRWQIAANPYILPDKTSINFSASMIYSNIDGAATPDKIVDACNTQMDSMSKENAGQLKKAEI